MAKAPTNKMRIRMNFVLTVILVVGFATLIFRLYQIQIRDGQNYQKLALEQQLRSTTISAKRGSIFDRNMKTLAASATVWTVFISPAQIADEAELSLIADKLSVILEVDRQTIIDRGKNKKSYYEIIKNKIEKTVADKVTRFVLENNIKSVNLEEDTKRYYPYGSLASTVLGFTGSENKGAYGVESYYDKFLSGTPGMVVSAKNAKGADMPFRYQQLYDPQDGNSVVLTIDEVVQHFLEKHLETAVVEHNVQNRAAGIVMNVKTGEILGMATKPDFDPNQPLVIGDKNITAQLTKLKANGEEEAYNSLLRQAQFDQWRNKAISDPYEPGSVFKIITASTALDLNVVKETGDYFTCPGYLVVAGRRKACWKTAGHGTIDFTQAIKFSCNPAFMMVGARIGAVSFYNYVDCFGFLEPTKIDLPGEADSYFYPLSLLAKESGEELASSSFGQTFKVTPIQLITAASAAVNGGKLMQPFVVKQVLDPEGNVISTTQSQEKRQVIAQGTSKRIASLLEHVVKDPDGSGKYAYIPGYRVGGKTGTSEKLDKKVEGQVAYRVASFLGFAPADDPEIMVLVLLDEPHMQNIYGSVIAAPVVGGILSDILSYLGVEPQYTESELAALDVSVPYVTDSMIHDAQSKLTALGLKNKVIGSGTKVLKQIPGSGQPMPKGGTVLLYTQEEKKDTKAQVPNVVGMSGQQANKAILNAGFNIKIMGIGIEKSTSVATKQTPAAGESAELGSVITVQFLDKEAAG